MPPTGLPIWAASRADSTSSVHPWRAYSEKKTTSLSSTLKMHGAGGSSGRDWLASTRRDKDVLPSHGKAPKQRDDDGRSWKDASRIAASAKEGLVADLTKTLQKVLPSHDVLPLTSAPSPRHPPRGGLRSPMSGITLPTSGLLALPAPETLRFVLLCALWYTSSALSSNTGKSIMNQFKYPITLTFIQFGFVAGYCLLFMSPLVRFSRLRRPTRAILRDTMPMGLFQVGGHIFSSMAISRIPVSTVHTIKALSPLFTVAAYALMFGVRYSAKTYVSLLPLTLGVMLACTFDMSISNGIGFLCALGSALIFVSSNIFFKKVIPTGADAHAHHKLDKLNLLFYSSSMAFLLMIPIWLYADLGALLTAAAAEPGHVAHPSHGHSAPHSVAYYLVANGTVHFAQNIVAFVILASVSPVTYSIASLFKRVAVICMALVWFSQRVHPVQACGIALTFVGLWMYNNAKGDVARGENKRRGVEARREGMLPTTREEEKILAGGTSPPSEPIHYHPNPHQHQPPLRPAPTDAGVSLASGRTRALSQLAAPLRTKMEMHTPLHAPERRAHAHPNLHIEIIPPSPGAGPIAIAVPGSGALPPGGGKGGRPSSPTELYPSPPLSLDSPPLTSAGLAPVPVPARV